jgi:hypothetical protein
MLKYCDRKALFVRQKYSFVEIWLARFFIYKREISIAAWVQCRCSAVHGHAIHQLVVADLITLSQLKMED